MTAVRYLLVGNAPNPNLAAAKHANAIIQFNACPNAEALAAYHTPYVFVVNTGHATSGRVVEQLRPLRPLLPDATIVLARNPTYYTLKKWILRECGQEHWRAFQISSARACLRDLWRIETLSFLSSLRVDLLMMAKGMPFPYQPSTGLIAYHWLRQRLKPGDSLDVTGFTFEGWEGHPWKIEKTLLKPIYPPGYRDDPSYEKRPDFP